MKKFLITGAAILGVGTATAATTPDPAQFPGGLSGKNVIHDSASTLNGQTLSEWGVAIDGKNPITTVTSTTSPTISVAPTTSDISLFTLIPTSDTVITLGAGGTSGRAQVVEVEITQPSTGGYTCTFSGTIAWPNGATPVVSTAAGDKTFIRFLTTDGGQTYIGGI